jgi:CHAT domain-containing protein/Tfp pilus assembly protein PilF
MELGQYDKGLYYGEQVLEMARKNKDEDSEHDILTTMGVVYLRLGSLQKAKEYLTLSAELSEKLKDPRSIALGIANLGAVYSRLKEYDKSVELFEKSLPVMRQLKWSRAIVIFGYYYGMVLREQGKIDKAIELHKESVELAHTAQTPKYEARALCELGLDYLAQGNFELARTQFSKALYIARQVKSRDEEAAALDGLMRVWNGNGQYKLGIFFGKQAVNLLQTTRNEIIKIDKQIQANFVKDNEQTYRKLVEILIADGRIAEAEQVLAMLKKEEVFTYLRRDDGAAKDLLQTVALTSREQETLLQYEAFADKITAIGKEFSELEAKRLASENGLTASDKVRYDELQAQLEIARAEFEKFLDKLKVEFGKNDLRVESVNSDLKSTLERIEAKRTAIVSVIVGGSRLNIIVTTANTQRAHTINVTEREVNELVAEFRQALINPKLDPRPAGQKLYNILVKPIEADLSGIQADTILWSLDGTLRYIPTAAIWDKQKGYLAERFANAFLTLANREALVQPVSDKKGWKALGVGVSKPTDGFTALAAVPDELDCIITDANTKTVSLKPVCQNGVIAGRKLLDENFTLTAFKDSMGRFPIVHIASHFSLNPGNEKDSFLLLGGGEQKRFTVDNLRGFSLTKVELIVLSACNTATPGGEKANGVEIEGFGAVAQRQGAKAVMATLWSVADDSTRDLMVKFYELYNKNNITKAEALKQAQTTMIYGRYKPAEGNTKRGAQLASSAGGAGKTLTSFEPDAKAPYSHPFYWSPFVLYGNWR